MSPNGFAFVNAEMVVITAIGGDLNEQQLTQFERDYRVLFNAEFSIPVFDGTTVWVGGRYNPDTGEFSPPDPQPDPLPTETLNDDAI